MLAGIPMASYTLPILSPSDFVSLLNQTLEFAYPSVVIEGELANFRISKNRWVYFDIKDDATSIRCFGSVYILPGPLENGMKLKVTAQPRFHPQFGFSLNLQVISLSGEGTIKKAFDLLKRQLTMEGLFEPARKRLLPYPPGVVGLITSSESAAYSDFIKILSARWGGVEIRLADVKVQGEDASPQVVKAIEWFNNHGAGVEVLVIVRGGGSMDDLQVFNTEQVARAVAASRIPTLAAIGHERDVTLAELAADLRASTPSNAAELLVPDRKQILKEFTNIKKELGNSLVQNLKQHIHYLKTAQEKLDLGLRHGLQWQQDWLGQVSQVISLLNPRQVLKRGYAVIKRGGRVVSKSGSLKTKDKISIEFIDGHVAARVQ